MPSYDEGECGSSPLLNVTDPPLAVCQLPSLFCLGLLLVVVIVTVYVTVYAASCILPVTNVNNATTHENIFL